MALWKSSLTRKAFSPRRQSNTINYWNGSGTAGADTLPPEVNTAYFDAKLLVNNVYPGERPRVAVIGVGYVGLQLVILFASKFDVIAFDISKERLEGVAVELASYRSVILTSNPGALACATHFLVSVPTLLLPDKRIDTSYIRSALATISTYARPGATVVIESSVSVGMTRQLLGSLMKSRGLKAGMSPERVDPGRVDPPLRSIPKIISGLDDVAEGSLISIQDLYSQVFDRVIAVSSPEVAEMTKLYKNCQRMVCIAYANEMADACKAYGIDPFEVCEAAATKPFGYLPFAPSAGVGGHCIPVNPYYLLLNNDFPLLKLATERMWARPARIAEKAMAQLKNKANTGKARSGRWPRVLVVGVAFKPGQSVLSYSPGVAIVNHLLEHWEAYVAFADPLVPQSALSYVPRLDEETEWNAPCLKLYDLIIVAVRQIGLDFFVLHQLEGVSIEWCTR